MGNGRKSAVICRIEATDSLPITNYQLPITNYQLPITNYQLHGMNSCILMAEIVDEPQLRYT
ncbi:MAG TPA: hypothetical protein DCZ55_08695, partial [Cyanobacteria bacterium UBA11371]|nr:hypothetical protein [Cyanobacteria bacterium UBA11371]